MSSFYDRQAKPIDVLTWREMCTEGYMRVAYTPIGRQRVSTLWVGINHRFGDGPPLIFETMVFPDCDYCVRTATEAAALAAHDQAVAHVAEQVRR